METDRAAEIRDRPRSCSGSPAPDVVPDRADLRLNLRIVNRSSRRFEKMGREVKQPDDWATFNTQSLLGGALLGQKKYADAEPLLLSGYRGMKQRQEKIPAQGKIRLTEALQCLVQLYEATGKKDEAEKWRIQLKSATPRPDKPKP
ncbi:MAG TPA: hypothetical protein VMF69_26470 [Gemmataceae bacterium]|nr:hypothetical protein [Gemmataceae bacterium]